MNPYVTKLNDQVNSDLLAQEFRSIVRRYNLANHRQVSVTSKHGDNNFECSVGKINALDEPESVYTQINPAFENTYIYDCIKRYPDFYRWRFLKLPGRSVYSIHHDTGPDCGENEVNYRIHIPIITNPHAYLMFYETDIIPNQHNQVFYACLEKNSVYKVNTSYLHSAVNHDLNIRVHLVGVTYARPDK